MNIPANSENCKKNSLAVNVQHTEDDFQPFPDSAESQYSFYEHLRHITYMLRIK